MKKYSFILILAILFTNCKKEEDSSTTTKVYTVGSIDSNTLEQQAVYWVDSTIVYLTNGNKTAKATAIARNNGDTYVSGYELNASNIYVAKYWKNGSPVLLSDGTNDAYANDIKIYNNDVYVVGEEFDGTYFKAKVWKNGVATTLPNSGNISKAKKIAIKDGKVYIVGTQQSPDSSLLWVNNVPFSFYRIAGDNQIKPSGIFANSTDVLITGYSYTDTYRAHYIKNNLASVLTTGTIRSEAYGCLINNDNVFIAGYTRTTPSAITVATYWKQGVPFYISDGVLHSYAYDIFVHNNDVYTAGEYYDGTIFHAIAWKNNEKISLEKSNLKSFAVGILVE